MLHTLAASVTPDSQLCSPAQGVCWPLLISSSCTEAGKLPIPQASRFLLPAAQWLKKKSCFLHLWVFGYLRWDGNSSPWNYVLTISGRSQGFEDRRVEHVWKAPFYSFSYCSARGVDWPMSPALGYLHVFYLVLSPGSSQALPSPTNPLQPVILLFWAR